MKRKGGLNMKKVIVVMLLALFAAQGIALAEDVKADVQAKAEPLLVEEAVVEDVIDPATGKVVEEDVVVAEELVTPAEAPAEEAKKM
jgi:hypothetical protein